MSGQLFGIGPRDAQGSIICPISVDYIRRRVLETGAGFICVCVCLFSGVFVITWGGRPLGDVLRFEAFFEMITSHFGGLFVGRTGC